MSALMRDTCNYHASYCEENVYKLCEQLIRRGTPADQLFACFISNPAKQIPLWWQRASREGPTGDGLVVWNYHVILLQTTPSSRSPPPSPPPSPPATTSRNPAPSATPSATTSPATPSPVAADVHGGGDHTLVSPAIAGASSAHTGGERGPVIIWDLDTALPFPCTALAYTTRALRHTTMVQLHQNDPSLKRWFRVVPALAYLTHFASDRSHMRTPPNSLGGGGRSIRASITPSSVSSGMGDEDGGDEEENDYTGHQAISCPGVDTHHSQLEETLQGQQTETVTEMLTNSPEDSGNGCELDQPQWQASPPPWPPLCSPRASCPHNLPQYWDVGPHNCVRQGHAPTCEVLVQQQGMSQWAASSSSGSVACDVDTGGGGQGGDGWWLGCVYDEEQFVRQILCVARSSSEGWVPMTF